MFCHTCISRAQNISPRCPSCNTQPYERYHSKNVEQTLNDLYVRCENHKDGCKWTGELGQYDSHLNLNSQLKERMDGCLHAKIKCHNVCGEAISRHHILLHEMKECSQKQDDHTELAKSLCADIQTILHEIEQKDRQIGEIKSQRSKSKEVHPISPSPDESDGKAISHHEIEKRYQKQDDHTELEKSLYFNIQALLHELEQKETVFLKSKKEMHLLTFDPDESATVVPVQRTITNFTERQEFVSEPFYTHSGGYKMCLWVFPNGYGDAENTHFSLFTSFMQGENDTTLKWPFRGNITVQLIDQVRNRDHRERIIRYDNNNSTYAQRVTIGEKSKGYGQPKMILLKSLHEETSPYLKDDRLKIRITKVELDFSE